MPKTWIASYPAKFLGMVGANTPLFEIWLGFDVSIKKPITIDIMIDDWEASKKLFLSRRIESILTNAREILIDAFWSLEQEIQADFDIEVDRVDLLTHIEKFL